MPATKLPGDLSFLGRTDPVARDASMFPYLRLTRGTVTNQERADALRNYNESLRRQFRQSEDADSGGYMAKPQPVIDDEELLRMLMSGGLGGGLGGMNAPMMAILKLLGGPR